MTIFNVPHATADEAAALFRVKGLEAPAIVQEPRGIRIDISTLTQDARGQAEALIQNTLLYRPAHGTDEVKPVLERNPHHHQHRKFTDIDEAFTFYRNNLQ